MSKKVSPRVFAIVVVGLQKFRILTAGRRVWHEREDLPVRLAGEALHRHATRLVNAAESRQAQLITVNGKVIKSSEAAGGEVFTVDEVAAQYGAFVTTDGAVAPTKTELTVAARGIVDRLAEALRMSPDTGATPLLERVAVLVSEATVAREQRWLSGQLREALQLNPNGDHTNTEMLVLVHKLVEEKKANAKSLAHFSKDAGAMKKLKDRAELLATPAAPPASSRMGKLYVKVLEVEGENLTIEEMREAIRLGIGGTNGAQ